MNSSFHHGARTIPRDTGLTPVASAFAGTIFIVGTSPQYLVGEGDRTLNEIVLLSNKVQAVQRFGKNTSGYTLPRALDRIFSQLAGGAIRVMAVNVLDCDSAIATTTVTDASVVLDGEVLRLPRILTDVIIKDSTGTTTYIEDTDYSLDATSGIVTVIDGGNMSANATVLATYTYSSGSNKTQVTGQALTFPSTGTNADTLYLNPGVSALTVTGSGGSPSYAVDTDYAIDTQTGKLTRAKSGSIAASGDIEVTYQYVDPSTVQDSQIIGVIGGTTQAGNRTGLQMANDAYVLFGYPGRILIVPGYSQLENIAAAMETICDSVLGMRAIIDAPLGTSVQAAISGRGPQGTINFFSSSTRLVGAFPHLVAFDDAIGANTLEPYSPYLAGVWANKSEARGIHWSPSNTEINGIVGVELDLQYQPGQLANEVQDLNAVGIVTVASWFGSGIRTFGNRSFAYPTSTALDNFLNVRFAQDIIEEGIRNLAMQFVDRPITNELIDALIESARAYLRSLKNQNILVDFSFNYDPDDNAPTQIALGRLRFAMSDAPPPPAEDIGVYTTLDISLLNALNVGREPIAA